MTTSTPHADRPVAASPAPVATRPPLRAPGRIRRARPLAAFTLTELLVSATLTGFILVGVLSTFLLLGRTGLNTSAYVAMNSRLRVAIERFDTDVRLATDIRWHDERSLTLVMPLGRGPAVTYSYEAPSDPALTGRFIRRLADGQAPQVLASDIAPDFTFRRYRLPAADGSEMAARNDLETRQLEVSLRAIRPDARASPATQLAISARCVLRNKNSGT